MALLRPCNHDPLKMCDPCCVCSRLELEESKAAIRELVEALEKTLTALVSYKHYIPEPYKQNPIYIMGAHEAEKKAVELLSKYSPKGEK